MKKPTKLQRGVIAFLICTAPLLMSACGTATLSGPPDERLPQFADFGPKLSRGVLQHNVTGVTEVANGLMGYSVAIGDFNGDDRLDIATGVPGRESGMVVIRQSLGTNSFYNYYVRPANQDVTGADDYGWSLAAGDFNGDGIDDLAVGAPRHDVGGNADAGEAFVLYGFSNLGLSENGMTRIAQGQDGAVEAGDLLGWSLAAGDFNGDGYADLAIGAPGENFNGVDAGAVLVRWGSHTGLNRGFTPTLLTHPEPQAHSQFGYSLASGRFLSAVLMNGHGIDDLVISSPYRDVTEYSVSEQRNNLFRDAGEIQFYWGARNQPYGLERGPRLTDRITDSPMFGWSLAAGRFNGGGLDQLAVGSPNHLDGFGYVAIVEPTSRIRVLYRVYQAPDGIDETGDDFGYSLAAGDFNLDGFEDLAIGAPGEDWPPDSGVVYIRFGSSNGLVSSNRLPTPPARFAYFISQNSTIGGREGGDLFGSALAAGDLDGDGKADLAIGSPAEDIDMNAQRLENVGTLFIALSQAPRFGPFEGSWRGTISGDGRSSAAVRLDLQDRNNNVTGLATVASPGIIINIPERCASGDNDDEQPIGGWSLSVSDVTTSEDPGSFSDSGTISLGGYSIPYRLSLTVSPDSTRITGRFNITDPSPLGFCGGDRSFSFTLTKN